MDEFELGEKLIAINNEPLKGNTIAPPLIVGREYEVISIAIDKAGNQHLNVGLKSRYNWISSYETKEELPNGTLIHWCHPSRFNKV